MTTTETTFITATGLSRKRFGMPGATFYVKLCVAAIILLIPSLFLLSFKTADRVTGDLWKQLGISQQQGSEAIKNGFLYGYIDNSSSKNLRNLTAGNKANIARDLVVYTKTYLNSPVFKAAYAKERDASKPQTLKLAPVTKESIRKERIDELRRNIREAEESLKKMPALEKSAQKAIAGYQNAIKDYESPDSKMLTIFYETEVSQQQSKQQQYDKKMKDWATNYPENHNEKIKRYLENYLAVAATVDFDAELMEKQNKKVFVNKAYESKHGDWKRIYRGGRDVYNAMKPLAEQWLKEIQ